MYNQDMNGFNTRTSGGNGYNYLTTIAATLAQAYSPTYEDIKLLCKINGVAKTIASFFPKYALMKGRNFIEINELSGKDFNLSQSMEDEYASIGLWTSLEMLGEYASMFGYAGLVILNEDNNVFSNINDSITKSFSKSDAINKNLIFNVVDPLALRPVNITTDPTSSDYMFPRHFRLQGYECHSSRIMPFFYETPYYLEFNNASISFCGFSIVSRVFGEILTLEAIKQQMAFLSRKVGTPNLGGMEIYAGMQQAENNLGAMKDKLRSMGFSEGIFTLKGEELKIIADWGLTQLQELFEFIMGIIASETRIQRQFLWNNQTEGGIGNKSEIVFAQYKDSLQHYQQRYLNPICKKLDSIVFLRVLYKNFGEKCYEMFNKYFDKLQFEWNEFFSQSEEEKAQSNSVNTQSIISLLDKLTSPQMPLKARDTLLSEAQKMGFFKDLSLNDLAELEATPPPQSAGALPNANQEQDMFDSFFFGDLTQKKRPKIITKTLF